MARDGKHPGWRGKRGSRPTRPRCFFNGHPIESRRWPVGPAERRLPGFNVLEIGPGPRLPRSTYISRGCWSAVHTPGGHGLEFVLTAPQSSGRHVEVVTMAAYYHAGPVTQRLDRGHTVPIGEPWVAGSAAPHLSVVPITNAERVLEQDRGADALEERLEQAAVDVSDPFRASIV